MVVMCVCGGGGRGGAGRGVLISGLFVRNLTLVLLTLAETTGDRNEPDSGLVSEFELLMQNNR